MLGVVAVEADKVRELVILQEQAELVAVVMLELCKLMVLMVLQT
jgi:hypothetical protein